MIKILYGNEPYRLDFEREKALKPIENPAMNYSHLQGEFSEDVLNACRVFPFFSDKRLVLLDVDSLKDLDTKAFKTYLSEPSGSTDLLVICRKVDCRLKIYKTLKDFMVPCIKVTTEDEFNKVVLYEVKKNGARISSGALKELSERINYFNMEEVNLLMVKDFIESLSGISPEITKEMVERYVPCFEEANVFSLAKLINERDMDGLLRQLNMLGRDAAIQTLSLLLYNFRVALKENYFSLSEIGARPSVFSCYSVEKLNFAVRLITDQIAKIKSGYMPEETALKSTIGTLVASL